MERLKGGGLLRLNWEKETKASDQEKPPIIVDRGGLINHLTGERLGGDFRPISYINKITPSPGTTPEVAVEVKNKD